MSLGFWAGIGPMWQIIGILALVVLVVLLFLWPSSAISMALAALVVVASLIVTWEQVTTYRMQKAAGEAMSPQAGITAPAANLPHSGT